MSMSKHVEGIVPPDQKWRDMKRVYDACEKAGIDLPVEVDAFFDGEIPCDQGAVINLIDHIAVQPLSDIEEMAEGYNIEIAELPKNVKFIRFYMSW